MLMALYSLTLMGSAWSEITRYCLSFNDNHYFCMSIKNNMMNVSYTTFSEAGIRRVNQDVCRVVEMPECDRMLMVVCDGLGGHAM